MRAMLATDTRMFRLDREAQSRAKPRAHGTGTEGRCVLQETQQPIGTSGGGRRAPTLPTGAPRWCQCRDGKRPGRTEENARHGTR